MSNQEDVSQAPAGDQVEPPTEAAEVLWEPPTEAAEVLCGGGVLKDGTVVEAE